MYLVIIVVLLKLLIEPARCLLIIHLILHLLHLGLKGKGGGGGEGVTTVCRNEIATLLMSLNTFRHLSH